MSKKGKIEPEELRFIYKLILEGRSDSDILNEYRCLSDIGQLDFPLRTDDSFVKDRRLEMEVASEVLEDSIKKMMGPFILKHREDHFTQLAEISVTLLQNNLRTVARTEEMDNATESRYIIKDNRNTPIELNRWQLVTLFRENVEAACERYTIVVFYQYYIPHLKASMPEMETEGFWPEVEKQPYEVITRIKELVKRKEHKGTCPLCRDLESCWKSHPECLPVSLVD